MHPETIRSYLKFLAGLGVVTRTHRYSGWMLTAGGRQMILGQAAGQLPAVGARQFGTGFDSFPNAAVPLPSGKINTSAEKPRSSVENPRSRPAAAASLSLSFKEEKEIAAEAITDASAEISSSRLLQGKPSLAATGKISLVQANLRAFASFGLVPNSLVLEVCKMDHVTPDYVLGQKRRLEGERRYSTGSC